MIKRYATFVFAALMALALIGCQSMPAVDTPGKRFAVFEISYQEVLKTATLYRTEGRLSGNQVETLDGYFKKVNATRELALRAWLDNDMPEFDNRMQALTGALQLARAVLVEAESNGK